MILETTQRTTSKSKTKMKSAHNASTSKTKMLLEVKYEKILCAHKRK